MSGPGLNAALFAPLQSCPKARRILVAYSGGLDSRVLLHLVVEHRAAHGLALEAVHIDHGMQANSASWAEHCSATCQSYGIACHVLKAELQPASGDSVEAVARDKRYQLFASLMQAHDLLLLAQHADDQAETVLLQLLRGAGPEGLSAMPYRRKFAEGHLIRPLLSFSRSELAAYAQSHQLNWIEDPSNTEDRFDRNYLRQHVFPLLEERFPGYRKTLARSARHCAELVASISAHARAELKACLKNGTDILSISALKGLPPACQKQVLRSWIKSLGCKVPQSRQLSQMLDAFCEDNPDPLAAIETSDYQVRRYQDGLHMVTEEVKTDSFSYPWNDLSRALQVPELNIELSLQSLQQAGIKLDPTRPAAVRSRQGGEKLRCQLNRPRKTVKSIFQEQAIPPWERYKYPLIYQNDMLVAVLGCAVDPDFQTPGKRPANTQSEADLADS